MKLPKFALSLGEQAFASGFTFCLFLAAARLLGQPGLELYTALFSLNQSFSFFLFGLVLLPMASSTGKDAGKQLGISIVLLGGLLLIFALVSPLAMRFFSSFEGRITPQTWLLSLGFFVSQCMYEATRWLSIRLSGARTAFAVTVTRFVLFFAGILMIGAGRLDTLSFVLAQVAVNGVAMIGFAFGLRNIVHEVHLALPDRHAIKHFANLGTSVANFMTNFVTLALVDRGLGSAALAAFQALRSATNPIGLLSQVIDNHVSADLARSGRSFTGMARAMRYALIGSAMLLLLTTLLGPQVVHLLFGDALAQHWILLPLLLMASLAHALTRPVFVDWRLAGDTRALNLYTLLVIAVVLPALVLLGWVGWTLSMITIFSLLPTTALLVHVLRGTNRSMEPPQ